jgi:hypothetical protein
MRILTAEELASATAFLSLDLPTAYLELTRTGLDKAILDATESVRRFLSDNAIHHFANQAQGTNNKVTVVGKFVRPNGDVTETTVTFYRPDAKNGDPRLWVYGLKSLANAGDILLLSYTPGDLWISNISTTRLDVIAQSPNEFSDAIAPAYANKSLVVDDLTMALLDICAMGYLPAPGAGDTMVGRVLETALGIEANSNRAPDFFGIELKAYRLKPDSSEHAMKRRNLFAKTPDWKQSVLKSSRQILDEFGYDASGVRRLYCEVRSTKFNTQGLRLRHDPTHQFVHEISTRDDIPVVASWPLSSLENALSEKHAETFWIGADSLKIDGVEHFRYLMVEHTQQPLVEQFGALVELGVVSMDHLIKEKGAGANEKGPLFKIDNSAAALLFPAPRSFRLDSAN